MSDSGFTGIAYPFCFNARGGVKTSSTDENDFSHIEQSIRQIVNTFVGERIFSPEFGSNTLHAVFANLSDPLERGTLKYEIQQAVEKWDTRVKVIDIVIRDEVTADVEYTVLDISIFVIKYLRNEVVTIVLNTNNV